MNRIDRLIAIALLLQSKHAVMDAALGLPGYCAWESTLARIHSGNERANDGVMHEHEGRFNRQIPAH